MPVVEESVVVACPPERVWPYLIDPAVQTRWQSGLTEYEPLDAGPPAVGMRYRGVNRVAGRRIDWTSEITALHDGESLTARSLQSPVPFRLTLSCEDAGGGTRVRYRLDSDGFGRFFGGVAEVAVTALYRRDLRAGLERLRVLVEAENAGEGGPAGA